MRRGPTREQKERAARRHAKRLRWDRAKRVRDQWTPEQFEAEELRLQAEIAALLAQRDAQRAA